MEEPSGLHGVCCVAAGGTHTLAVAKDGTTHGWGDGEDETLGLQLTEDRRTPLAYSESSVPRTSRLAS